MVPPVQYVPPPPNPPWDWQVLALGEILTPSQQQTVLGRLRTLNLIPKTTTTWPSRGA